MRTGILAACLVLSTSLAGAPARADSVAARPSALPFVEDDYGRALGEARASKRPLFVEAWAPW